MVISDLPVEILIDIFSRLPAKSVGSCRCLAKSWRTLLSSPHFIKSHLARKPDHQNLILITVFSRSVLSVATIEDGATSAKLDFSGYNFSEVAGSCDGLVLLVNLKNEKLLVNPITLQQVIIPDSPLALEKGKSSSVYGLGYDRSSDDYKIVAFSHDLDDTEPGPDTFVDVYSAKRGVWKRVENSPYIHILFGHAGAFLNGAIHWFASRRESIFPFLIVAFSLADEVFDEIPAPSYADMDEFVNCRLVVVGGCLCAVCNSCTGQTDIWIMKEYGRGNSWTMLSGGAEYIRFIEKPLCYVGDEEEEILLLTGSAKLVVYNRNEGRLRTMIVNGAGGYVEDGATFVPTLVSPPQLMEL